MWRDWVRWSRHWEGDRLPFCVAIAIERSAGSARFRVCSLGHVRCPPLGRRADHVRSGDLVTLAVELNFKGSGEGRGVARREEGS